MNILILVVLMSAFIVLFAVAADRSARANRRWRAGLLNLCGLLLLALGVFALFTWSHHGHVVSTPFGLPAHAGQVWTEPAIVDQSVRSLRDEDRPADTPDANPAETPAESAPQLPQTAELPAAPAEQPAETTEPPAAPEEPPAAPAEQPAETTEPPAALETPPVAPAEQPAETPAAESAETTGSAPEPQAEDATAEPSGSDGASELSASPQPQVEIDYGARPDWVDRPAREEGRVHQIAVCSGPYLRSHDAHKELQRQLKRVTDEYINEFLGQASASRWVSWDAARIGRELVAARNHFEEKVISPSFGVMYQSHALLEFGPEFHGQVEESWRQVHARAQLVKVAFGAAAVLGTLMLLFGFFQADTATRGFYSGRLKFATAVAILGLIACGAYLARSIPWLWP